MASTRTYSRWSDVGTFDTGRQDDLRNCPHGEVANGCWYQFRMESRVDYGRVDEGMLED